MGFLKHARQHKETSRAQTARDLERQTKHPSRVVSLPGDRQWTCVEMLLLRASSPRHSPFAPGRQEQKKRQNADSKKKRLCTRFSSSLPGRAITGSSSPLDLHRRPSTGSRLQPPSTTSARCLLSRSAGLSSPDSHLAGLLKIRRHDPPPAAASSRPLPSVKAPHATAEKLGLPSAPPYLSIGSNTQAFFNGVNFASGGAGIFDATHNDECLSLNKQIDYLSTVSSTMVEKVGNAKAQGHLAKSIFVISIGSNDIFGYVRSNGNTHQQFIASLISQLQGQLQRIYNIGARKFVFTGTGLVGCCPALRTQSDTGDCKAEANSVSNLYNQACSFSSSGDEVKVQ